MKMPLVDAVISDTRPATPIGDVLDQLDETLLDLDELGQCEILDLIAIYWRVVDVLRGQGYAPGTIFNFYMNPWQKVEVFDDR